MLAQLSKASALVAGLKNPLPALADGLGWRNEPYRLSLRNGTCIELRPRVGDLFGFYEIMLRRDYLAGGQTLRPGATVVDIGANIGCFSVLAAQAVGPAGRVIAVEPEPNCYRQLVRNIELNALTNVVPVEAAVGANDGRMVLHSDPNSLFSSMFDSVNGRNIRGTDRDVRVLALQGLLDAHGITHCDYLKLDCEGAEHEILAAMSQPTAARIDQITLEIHSVPGHDGETLRSHLMRLGFERIGASTLPYYRRSRLPAQAQGPEASLLSQARTPAA